MSKIKLSIGVKPPNDPINFRITGKGTNYLDLAWDSDADSKGWELVRAYENGSEVSLATFASGITSHTISSLSPNTLHRLGLRGLGGRGSNFVYRWEITDHTVLPIIEAAQMVYALNGATSVHQTKVNSYLTNLHNDGILDYLFALYIPCVGGSLANKLYNYLAPFNQDYCFRGTVVGSVESVTNGIRNTVVNVNCIDFKIFPDEIANAPMLGFNAWVSQAVECFLYNGDPSFFPIVHSNADGKAYCNIGAGSPGVASGSNAAGWWDVQRDSFDLVTGKLNDVLKFSDPRHIDQITAPDSTATYFPTDSSIKLNITQLNTVVSVIAFKNNPMPSSVQTAFYNHTVAFLTDMGII
jgi:hypothetical protein